MNYITTIKLDIYPNSDTPVVRIKRGDASARYIKMCLMNGSDVWTPDNSVLFTFRCEKPDRTAVVIDSETTDAELGRRLLTVSGNELTLEVVEQIGAVNGRCKCDICMTKNNQILSTIPFVIDVVDSPDISNQVVSSNDLRTLQNILATIAVTGSQNIFGKFNEIDTQNQYLVIVGNGTSDSNRSNAFSLKSDGTFVFANGTEITPADFEEMKNFRIPSAAGNSF